MGNQTHSLETVGHVVVDVSDEKQQITVIDWRDDFCAWYKDGQWIADDLPDWPEHKGFRRIENDAEVLKILAEARKALGSDGPIEVTEEHERTWWEKEANRPPIVYALKSTYGGDVTLYDERDGFEAHYNDGRWQEGGSVFLTLDDEDLEEWDAIEDKQEVERLIAEARQALKESAE